jgi:hypothetical protein
VITSVNIYQTTRGNIPSDGHLHTRRRESLKSHLVLEHYFASKLFAAVCEAFSNAYPDKEVPNKTIIHRPVIKFRDRENVYERKHVRHWTVLTDETLRNAEEKPARWQQKSLRRLSQQSGLMFENEHTFC